MTQIVEIGNPLWNGQTIGLLGGSFNPAHRAHSYIAEEALKRLGLDSVWLLVSPGNPLKSTAEMARFEDRLKSAEGIAQNPHIFATDIEHKFGTNRTYDTVLKLIDAFPNSRFVWLMGADNMQQFNEWHAWEEIACTLPIAIFDRPEYSNAITASGFAQKFKENEIQPTEIYEAKAPAWTFIASKRDQISSSAIRETEGLNWSNTDRKT